MNQQGHGGLIRKGFAHPLGDWLGQQLKWGLTGLNGSVAKHHPGPLHWPNNEWNLLPAEKLRRCHVYHNRMARRHIVTAPRKNLTARFFWRHFHWMQKLRGLTAFWPVGVSVRPHSPGLRTIGGFSHCQPKHNEKCSARPHGHVRTWKRSCYECPPA